MTVHHGGLLKFETLPVTLRIRQQGLIRAIPVRVGEGIRGHERGDHVD